MEWVRRAAILLAIVAAMFAIDRLGLWMETRGWIYWRKKKRKGAAGVVELFGAFDPGLKHLNEVRQKAREERGREIKTRRRSGGR